MKQFLVKLSSILVIILFSALGFIALYSSLELFLRNVINK